MRKDYYMSFEESVYVNQTATDVSSSFVQPDGGKVVASGIVKKLLLSLLIPSVVILFIIACAYFLFRRKKIAQEKFISRVSTLKDKAGDARFSSKFIAFTNIGHMLSEHINKATKDELISAFNVFLLHIRKHSSLVMNIGYVYVEHYLEDNIENMNLYEQLKLFIVLYKHWKRGGFMTYRVEKVMNKLKNILKRNFNNMDIIEIFENLKNQPIENITVLQFMQIDLNAELNIDEILDTIQNTQCIRFNENKEIKSHMDFKILKGHINEELFLDEYYGNSRGGNIKFPELKNISREEICKIHEVMWKKQEEITKIISGLNLDMSNLLFKINNYYGAIQTNDTSYKPSLELSKIMYWGNYCHYLIEMFTKEIISLSTEDQFSMLYFAEKKCISTPGYGVYTYMEPFSSVIMHARGCHLYRSQHSIFDGDARTPRIRKFKVEYQIMAAYAKTFYPRSVLVTDKDNLQKLLATGGTTVNFDSLKNIAIQLEEDPERVMEFCRDELGLNPVAQIQQDLIEFLNNTDSQSQINEDDRLNNFG